MSGEINKTDCPLFDSRYCRLLNMRSCAQCTMKNAEDFSRVKADLDLYEELLPTGGISRLFTEKTCQFCREETKGRRHGYALLDMAHPEPKRIQNWLLGKMPSKIGTMVPVQMGICDGCRKKLLLIEYLPLAAPIAVGTLGLILLYSSSCADEMMGVGAYAPFFVWLLAVVLAVIGGNLAAGALKKRFSSEMIVDVSEHPVIVEMVEKGWFPLYKQSKTKLLFSKSRLARGLGTWDGEGDEKQPQAAAPAQEEAPPAESESAAAAQPEAPPIEPEPAEPPAQQEVPTAESQAAAEHAEGDAQSESAQAAPSQREPD